MIHSLLHKPSLGARLCLLVLILSGLLIGAQTSAAESKRYRVEMMLIAYTNEADIKQETWPAVLEPKPRVGKIRYISPSAPSASFREQIDRVRELSNAQIIWQASFEETIQPKSKAYLHALNQTIVHDNTRIHLQGTFSLHLSRYLHFSSDFTLQHSDAEQKIVSTASEEDGAVFLANGERAIRAANIVQKRRMRSKELHYIDHPMLGTLIHITPIN